MYNIYDVNIYYTNIIIDLSIHFFNTKIQIQLLKTL